MTGFTKGTWKIDEDFDIFCNDIIVAICAGTKVTEGQKANARLIVHAPKMYKVLKKSNSKRDQSSNLSLYQQKKATEAL